MKYYGIFDKNNNYKLLRYSTTFQNDKDYQQFDFISKTFLNISETCIPEIDYDIINIGKGYNPNTKTFFNL